MKFRKHIIYLLALAVLPLAVFPQTDLFPEFAGSVTNAAITHDGKKIVFLGEQNETKNVYESVFENGKWSNPQVIPAFDNLIPQSPKGIGGFSFNYDGTQLLFHINFGVSFDIMSLKYENGEWGSLDKFPAPVNSVDDEFSPSISADNNYIFLLRPKRDAASQKKQDIVCKEIVMYRRNKDGVWTGPQFIPQTFNEGCQETPFICADGKTLFFSSMRPDTTSEGKKVPDDVFNIYYTSVLSENIYENVWKMPKYVDEFSTEFNDLSPKMNNDASVFIKNTSPRKVTKKQPDKTYQIAAPAGYKPKAKMQLKGQITDLDTKQPVDAQIVVTDAITSAVLGEYTTNAKGMYSIYLNENGNYKIDYGKSGYSHSNYYVTTGYYEKDVVKQFDTTIFSSINYYLNVYDKEIYSPLSPKISVYDSITNNLLIDSLSAVGSGRYKGQIKIGQIYKIHIECEHFEPRDIYFDAVADVFYNEFEEDIELSPAKKVMILDIDAGAEGDSVLVNVKNLSRNESRTVMARRDKDGNLIVELREGDSYEIDVAKKGYTFSSTKVDVGKTNKTQKLNIKLDLLTKNTKMTFNNITFETNSAELNAESFKELNRLIEFMKLNDNVRIELSAHTDDVGPDWYNMILSQKRAQVAVKYLKEKGVKESAIVAKGYGELHPIVPNNSDANRAQNRRIEVKIIDRK
ncbi:MAG: OmpA family protein [Salinivirgaceae bacterium]|nr:OmpA family protein [Salinivirgaceae bacterium]